MALQKQPLSWPLTGGISSKTAPLQVQPGSHLTLDNVRQERDGEWRKRWGHTSVSNGFLQNLVKFAPLPAGGAVGMARQTATSTAFRAIAPSQSAGGLCYVPPASAVPQSSPSAWSRRPAVPSSSSVAGVSFAAGGGYELYAIADTVANVVRYRILSQSEGTIARLGPSNATDSIGVANSTTPGAAYCNGFLVMVAIDAGGNVNAYAHDTANSLNLTTKVIGTDATVGPANVPSLDVVCYSGSSTVTIVYRTNANTIKFVEYNPSTNALATSVTIAQDCSTGLCLFPDPDASGLRFVIASTSTPSTRVLRINSAGAVQTNDVADAARAGYSMAGCAYTAGAEWMIVFVDNAAGNLYVVKKVGGVVGTSTALLPYNTFDILLASNGWREASTDLMHFVVALNRPVADPQNSYFEMVLDFAGSTTVTKAWLEPQARMLPLEASAACRVMPQVQRLGTDQFALALPRSTRFEGLPSGPAYQYAIDRWTQTVLNRTTLATANQSDGIVAGDQTVIPAGSLLATQNGSLACAHGLGAAPYQPALTPGGGGLLTAGATYGFRVVVEAMDDGGNVWISPPSSTLTLTLSGVQTSIAVAWQLFPLENKNRTATVKFYMTSPNGSVYQLFRVLTDQIQNLYTISFNITTNPGVGGELLSAELPNGITSPMSHVALFGGRLWGSDRDFDGDLYFTKPIQRGITPGFVDAFTVDIESATGPTTALAHMDDQLVVLKASAIYVVRGDGPDNGGGGSFPSVIKVASDVGCIAGGVAVSTGTEVFFTSARGIYRINRSLDIDFVGKDVDQYLNQPQVRTPETITCAVFSSTTNEVRFQTTTRRLVFDRLRSTWMTDSASFFQLVQMSIMSGNSQLLVDNSNGALWTEGGSSALDDGGSSFTGVIRSAWIRPAGVEGWLRLYRGRVMGLRTSGGSTSTPTLKVYFDNDNTLFATGSPSTPLAIGQGSVRAEVRPNAGRQKCTAFSLELTLPAGDATTRIDAWAVEVGMKQGAQKLTSNERWS